jgi:integrase/recombinase XerD
MLLVNEKITQYLNHLLVERGASTNTLKAYERDLRRYESFLAEINCSEITPEVISEHVSQLRKSQLSESSIARAVVALRNFHQFLAKENGLPDPTSDIDVPKIPKRLPKALSVNEVTELINSCGTEGVGIRDRAMIELLYASGARVSELTKLDIDDVAEISLVRVVKNDLFRLVRTHSKRFRNIWYAFVLPFFQIRGNARYFSIPMGVA